VRLKKSLHIAFWLLLLAGMLFMLTLVGRNAGNKTCSNVFIHIDTTGGNRFVTKRVIWSKILSMGDSLKGRSIKDIDFNRLEQAISSISSVHSVSVYAMISGDLFIDVSQRTPVIRVHNMHDEQFYIDTQGKMMELSENYSAPVVIATGYIDEKFSASRNLAAVKNDTTSRKTSLQQLYELAMYLQHVPFWEAQIDQIYIDRKNEIIVYPRLGDHAILLGNTNMLEEKFFHLMLFYKKVLSILPWDTYSTINLKFRNQIVCTKS